MPDEAKPNPSLTQIGHLFLSDVRERQMGDTPRPRRIPPGGAAKPPSIDVSFEEMMRGFDAASTDPGASGAVTTETGYPQRMVSIVLANHLGDGAAAALHRYASHLAAQQPGGRVAMVRITQDGVSITCVDLQAPAPDAEEMTDLEHEALETGRLAEAIEEMSWDTQRWLVALPAGVHSPAARAALRVAPHWVLLSNSDDDGIVAGYRALKTLVEIQPEPELSVALLDAADHTQAAYAHKKLASVSRQFLHCTVQMEPHVWTNMSAPAIPIVNCPRVPNDLDPLTEQTQWEAIGGLLAQSSGPTPAVSGQHSKPVERASAGAQLSIPEPRVGSIGAATARPASTPIANPPAIPQDKTEIPAPLKADSQARPFTGLSMDPTSSASRGSKDLASDIIELPRFDAPPSYLLGAVSRQSGAWVASPVQPPMCDCATVAIGRNGALILVAVAGVGLTDLRSIATAYRWMCENKILIRMALPQFTIDLGAAPALRLYVDHADLQADILQPMLERSHVAVQAYRKLRWGEKTGLLLDAA